MSTRDARRVVWEFVCTLAIAFVLVQLVMTSVAQAFQVEQYSMQPNLLPRDRVLVNKFVYRFRPPHPGEIVVLHPPNDPARDYIKRVVAVTGQTVQIRAAHVFIDGRMLREPYLRVPTDGAYGPVKVPAREIFVLGDNRDNSEDSRAFGFVPDASLVGEAILIYWPPRRVRLLH